MRLRITRKEFGKDYTIGQLHVLKDGNWVYLCDTLENAVKRRKPGKIKRAQSAILFGEYLMTMNVRSELLASNYKRFPWARPFRGYVPRLLQVEQFDGIIIRPGTIVKDAPGCIFVGWNTRPGKLTDSIDVFNSLMKYYFLPAKKSGEQISLEIVREKPNE